LDGFWIHRVLQGEGVESHVVDPASIATSRRRVKSVGKGVHEARIDFGPAYRIYFAFDGRDLILLLGQKHGQDNDIAAAQARWVDYKQRKRAAAR
jgi:putative addiction module killer protein